MRRPLRFEHLENKQLLAADIVWVNEFATGNLDPEFDRYNENEPLARALVNRAIDDWERVITSFNYDDPNLNDTFQLTVRANPFSGGIRGDTSLSLLDDGVPIAATISMDDNGGGVGWYFDETLDDSIEFPSLAGSFQSSFVDAGQTSFIDFYTVIAHEIGHALGLRIQAFTKLLQFSTAQGTDQVDGGSNLWEFNNPTGQFNVTATFTSNGGGHLYEGPADPNFPNAPTHPHDLLNAGRTLAPDAAVLKPTTRQVISDLDAMILADAYGFSVTLPSTFDSLHTMLDPLTGQLLVQGLEVDDTISITTVGTGGDTVRVDVNGFIEEVDRDDVTQILIAGNGGTDSITVDSALAPLRQDINYVVSSNEDILETGTVGDGLVDLDSNVPGNQVSLRAAVRDANNRSGADAIYVGRGVYDLTLTGTGGDTEGDLDISDDMTIVGAGAGISVIEAPSAERHFEVDASSTLDIHKMTLTGGTNSLFGSSIYVAPRATSGSDALTLNEAAVVNNGSAMLGGAVFVGAGAKAQINKSVIANDSALYAGGGISASASSAGFAEVTLSQSIVANNNSTVTGAAPDLASTISGSNMGTFLSEGYNLIGEIGAAHFTPLSTDHESPTGSVDYVVTSVKDTFDYANHGDARLSLREAIDLANTNDNLTEEVWLPAWDFVLTRDRETYGGGSSTDIDASFGDLDISDTLIIRGVDQVTSVRWRSGVSDAVFDLLGDYTGTGLVGSPDDGDVDGHDSLAWQLQNGSGSEDPANWGMYSADGDDDGDVDADDYNIRFDNYGNFLTLEGIEEILSS